MADWKFGDVLKGADAESGDLQRLRIMFIGRGGYFTADDHHHIDGERPFGMALNDASPIAFPPSGTAWIPEDWNWELVDD